MSISHDTVTRVAELARLAIPPEQIPQLASELSNVLGWIDQLSQVDTAGVEPLLSVNHIPLPLRADRVTDGDRPADILANAPERVGDFFAVPKVVE